MTKRRICFRADGSASIGLGHVMRSCALVEVLKDAFDCHFYIRQPIPFLTEIIAKAGAQIHALAGEIDFQSESALLAKSFTAEDIVVLDGYSFDTNYQRAFKERNCKVVCIDDISAYHFVADVVINHGPGIPQTSYSAEAYTSIFLGPEYALINDNFRQAARKPREIKSVSKCLICFGGADFNNITLKVLQLIEEGNYGFEIDIITGSAYSGYEALLAFVKLHKGIIRWHQGIPPKKILPLISQADIMICPASTILYEACAVGTGIMTGYFVDNQERIYHGFLKLNCVYGLGDFNDLDDQQFSKALNSLTVAEINHQITIQKKVIDGFSDKRFKEIFESL